MRKRGLFKIVHFLEILETLELLEILDPSERGKQRRIRPFYSEISRDSSSGKDPLYSRNDPFSVPDCESLG